MIKKYNELGECEMGNSRFLLRASMNGTCKKPEGKANHFERILVARLLRALGRPPIRLQLWDGSCACGDGRIVATVHILNRRTLWQLPLNPNLVFGDAYTAGDIEVEGDLVACLRAIYEVMPMQADAGKFNFLLQRLWRPKGNGLAAARRNIQSHYDLGNRFYRLWLDDEMVYSGAYYRGRDCSLKAAQQAKMQRICRKLRISPGDHVVEIGCGWGALARYIARHCGARVKAYNISPAQLRYAWERTRQEGLTDRIEYIEDDYRNVKGEFDVLVSVGMLEHVGVENFPAFGRMMDSCLKGNGRALIQSVGRNRPEPMSGWIERRIFPGAYVPALSEMLQLVEPHGFSMLGVENLRLHYARTLQDWLARFNAAAVEVEEMFDAAFVRAWRLYLAGCCAAFAAGSVQLFQLLLARPGCNELLLRHGQPRLEGRA